jgi:class 3 adenylate cyclase
MEDFQRRFRLDIKGVVQNVDPATGEVHVRALFDPSRYSLETIAGEPALVDHQDRLSIPLPLVQDLITKALSQAPVGQGQRLGDAREYVNGRRNVIKRRLTGTAETKQLNDPSAEYLSTISDEIHPFAILSADIVGSTNLSGELDPLTYARIIGTISDEFAAICPYFHAHVLKFTGDGILAYFPADAFLAANDNAIDGALTMRSLVQDAVNPALEEIGHPIVSVRIGIESGGAVATTLGDPATKCQRDLIGRTLSMACKIQSSGLPGEIRIGQVAYQNMHTMWKKGCVPALLPASWNYKLSDGSPHAVHVFTAAGAACE